MAVILYTNATAMLSEFCTTPTATALLSEFCTTPTATALLSEFCTTPTATAMLAVESGNVQRTVVAGLPK
jgi:hypothetical protein